MIIDREEYLAHISDLNDIASMRRILDKIEIVLKNHVVESTDFLDPWTRKLSQSILNRFQDISYSELGGSEGAERKVLMIYPDYYYLDSEDYSISALRLELETESLSHRDFLGAVLGLGIDRDKIGDIFIHDRFVDIVVKDEIESFILLNFKKVGNQNINVKPISLDKVEDVFPEYEEKYSSLSSRRLDVFISAAYNLSRKISLALVQSGKVKVNWEPIDSPSYELNEGDMISVRGYGRSYLHSINGISKKSRLKVNIRILI